MPDLPNYVQDFVEKECSKLKDGERANPGIYVVSADSITEFSQTTEEIMGGLNPIEGLRRGCAEAFKHNPTSAIVFQTVACIGLPSGPCPYVEEVDYIIFQIYKEGTEWIALWRRQDWDTIRVADFDPGLRKLVRKQPPFPDMFPLLRAQKNTLN